MTEGKKGWVMVTGGSIGIGYEIAKRFADYGYPILLVARNESKLQSVVKQLTSEFSVPADYIVSDLSQGQACETLAQAVRSKQLFVEVLVNNAGFGVFGEFQKESREKQMSMIDVNVRALTELSHLMLPAMLEKKRGGILNVASTAGFQPGPLMAVYYATKSYVLSFSEALAEELRQSPVKVSVLCPGATRTEFFDRASMSDSKLLSFGAMESSEVARVGVEGFLSGKVITIPGLKNRVMAQSSRVMPRAWVRRTVRYIQRKVK